MGDYMNAIIVSIWILVAAGHVAEAIDRNTDACTKDGDRG